MGRVGLALSGVLLAICLATAQGDEAPLIYTNSMPESRLLRRVEPVYPPLAIQYRIQGAVRLNAIIGSDGHIQRVTLVSGHPSLVPAALEAVRQWVYEPTLLEGKPARVATGISVHFQLDSSGKPIREAPREPQKRT